MSRPLICEPGLVKRWREGDRRPAACVSDNACFTPGLEGRGIYCVTVAKKRSKAGQYSWRPTDNHCRFQLGRAEV
jgi:hypothetical protein